MLQTAIKVESDEMRVSHIRNRPRIRALDPTPRVGKNSEGRLKQVVERSYISADLGIERRRSLDKKNRRRLFGNLRKTSADRFPSDVPSAFQLMDRPLIQPEPTATAFWELAWSL